MFSSNVFLVTLKKNQRMIRALSQKVEALKLTQEQMAQILQIDQANVSRLEKRADLMLSTLRKYVAAMGGELRALHLSYPLHLLEAV
jgi:predicted XRE-type DNA-binding protein